LRSYAIDVNKLRSGVLASIQGLTPKPHPMGLQNSNKNTSRKDTKYNTKDLNTTKLELRYNRKKKFTILNFISIVASPRVREIREPRGNKGRKQANLSSAKESIG